MDMDTIREIVRPKSREELRPLAEGETWLAGGTWLFSEPQPHLRRLIDLDALGWEPLIIDEAGFEIAATCRIAELYRFEPPAAWLAAPLFRQCCDALLASFKIWNTATVGGNLCLALPSGALIALGAALDGICVIWQADGGERRVAVTDFVTGRNRNVLGPDELLRAIRIPLTALHQRTAIRQVSLGSSGRSVTLVIGTLVPEGRFALTISAATVRPVKIDFAALPAGPALRERLAAAIPASFYFDDSQSSAIYRQRMTAHLAEEIRQELSRERTSCRSS